MPLDSAILAKMKASKNKYSRGTNTIKLKEGKTTIRLLQKGSDQFWKELGVHWIKTEKEGKPIAVVGCSDEIYGKPCPVCAALDKAKESATDEEKAILKDMGAKRTVLVAALIRTGADASEKPQLLELTGTTWGKILGTVEEYAANDIDALDAKNGIDFVVERTGKGLNTEYNIMVAPKSKPVPAEALVELPDFDAYIEKELFRGDERKALTAIGNFAGLPGLTAIAGSSDTTKRLTSAVVSDAVVDDAVVEETVDTEVAEVAKALVDEKVESEEEREERELTAKLEALAKKKAEKAAAEKKVTDKAAADLAAKKAAAASTVVTKDTKDAFTEPSTDDIESMLAELDD